MTSSNTPLHAADTPSHSLQVSNAQHQRQPLRFITCTHRTPTPTHESGKQQRWREREQRVSRPPGPAESACQLGKARWKQSHMMAAWVVAKGRCCSRCRPSRLLVNQSCWGGVSVAAQRWDGAETARQRRANKLLLPQSCPKGVEETLSCPVNTDLQRRALT